MKNNSNSLEMLRRRLSNQTAVASKDRLRRGKRRAIRVLRYLLITVLVGLGLGVAYFLAGAIDPLSGETFLGKSLIFVVILGAVAVVWFPAGLVNEWLRAFE